MVVNQNQVPKDVDLEENHQKDLEDLEENHQKEDLDLVII